MDKEDFLKDVQEIADLAIALTKKLKAYKEKWSPFEEELRELDETCAKFRSETNEAEFTIDNLKRALHL